MARSKLAELVPEVATSTNVPSNGRHRRISICRFVFTWRSVAFQRDFIEREKTFHSVGDVAATESRAADVSNIPVQLQLRLARLSHRLSAPAFIFNFAPTIFGI